MANLNSRLDDLNSLLGLGRRGSAFKNARAVRQLLREEPEDRRDGLVALGWNERQLQHLFLLPTPFPEAEAPVGPRPDYGQAFAKAERSLSAFLTPGRPPRVDPAILFTELAELSEKERNRRISTDDRFVEPELALRLIEHSNDSRYEDPAHMLHWAELAHIVADRCTTGETGSEGRLFDLKARAWGDFGNALRVCGRLREAGEALSLAHRLALQGTGDPMVKARLLHELASLNTAQRKFDRALELAVDAARIYRELGETRLLAAVRLTEAKIHISNGEPDRAVEILHGAITTIDGAEDPHLLLVACHNLVLCYLDLGLPEQALAIYRDTRELGQEFNDTLILLRVSWQEGQLLRDLGRLEDAEKALLRARDGFRKRGLAYDVALVSLDLAAVYVKLGFVDEVRRTVTEALPIFLELQIDREAIASFLQLQQVADQEAQALNLIRMVSARLEQLPGRFRPQR